MKKTGLIAIAATLSMGASVLFSTTETAQAATWHKNVPSAIRGTWKEKGGDLNYKFKITSSTFKLSARLGDPQTANKVMYHHAKGSSYYYLRGHETAYTSGRELLYYKVRKTGNHIKIVNYLTTLAGSSYKHSGYMPFNFYK